MSPFLVLASTFSTKRLMKLDQVDRTSMEMSLMFPISQRVCSDGISAQDGAAQHCFFSPRRVGCWEALRWSQVIVASICSTFTCAEFSLNFVMGFHQTSTSCYTSRPCSCSAVSFEPSHSHRPPALFIHHVLCCLCSNVKSVC